MTGPGFSDASRKVSTGQLVIAVSEAVRYALLLYLTIVLGRELDVASLGFLAIIPAIYLVAHVILDLGTGALIAREAARRPERERPLLEAALFARGLVATVLGLIVAGFAFAESDPDRRMWLFVTALSLPLLAPSVLGAAFRVRHDQTAPAILSLASILLMIAATLVGFRLHVSGPTFAGIYVLREVLNGIGIWIVARTRHGLRIAPGFEGRDAGAFFRAAIPQNTAVVFQIASLNVGVFCTRALLGDEELGAYSAAWRLVGPLLLLMGALVAPLLPVLAHRARSPEVFRRILEPATGLGAAIGAIGVGFVGAAGRDSLRLIFDKPGLAKFSSGPFDAYPCLLVLGFVFLAVSVGAIATTALLCLDGDRHLRALAIAAFLVNVVVTMACLPWVGRTASASGLLVAEILTAIGAMAVVVSKVGAPDWERVARALAPALLAVILMLLLPAGLTAVTHVLAAVSIAAIALAYLVIFGPGQALRQALHEPAA